MMEDQPGQAGVAPDWETIQRRTVETGGIVATGEAVVLATVLGSCVSVCLYDTLRRVGGMNHFLLPGGEVGTGQQTRFGSYAMEKLIEDVLRLGGDRKRLRAKVFGGGRVLPGVTMQDLGGQNVQFALEFVARESIPVVARLVQLHQPVEVRFFPQTGRAMVRRLPLHGTQAVVVNESSYQRRLKEQLEAGRAAAGDGVEHR